MDSTFYLTVYDAAQLPASGPMPFVAAALILVATAAMVAAWRRGWVSLDRLRLVFFSVAATGAALLGIVGSVVEGAGTRGLQSALESGEYELVAGRIENFVAGDHGGHIEETFSVTTEGRVHRYSYTHSRSVPGFHASAGPVRAGMEVRIADVDGRIARLEIKQGAGEPPVPDRFQWRVTSNADPRTR